MGNKEDITLVQKITHYLIPWSFLIWLTSLPALAQEAQPILLTDTTQYLMVQGRQMAIFEDSSNTFTLEKILNTTGLPFEVYQDLPDNQYPIIAHDYSTYWIKLTFKTTGINNKRWIFENMDPHIEHFEVYVPKPNGGFVELQAGFSRPFRVRDYHHKNFIIDLPVDSSATVVYIKAKSRIKDPFLFKVQTGQFYAFYSLREYYFLGLFYGIMLIMALYNLLLFFMIRERVYLYYVFYVCTGILVTLLEDGLGFQFIWPDYPVINWKIGTWAIPLMLLSFYFYSRAFLEIPKQLPRLNQLLTGLIALFILLSILNAWEIISLGGIPLFVFPFLCIYLASILAYRKGYKPARFFIIAYSFMMISILLLLLRMNGITFWSDLFTIYSFNIGLVFETVILSLALGDKVRIIKTEREREALARSETQQKLILQLQENEKLKDKVNRELEEKVKERTAELEEQTELVQKLNAILKDQNIQLKDDVKTITKSRVLQKVASYTEFLVTYPNEEACYKYLADIKWKSVYQCKRCKYESFSAGKSPYAHRCNRCGYDESATVGTLFHNIKFPIIKAFYIAYLVSNRKNFSVDEISETLELRRQTCLEFKRKAEDIMKDKKAPKNLHEDWGYLLLL